MAIVQAEEGGLGVIDRGFRPGEIEPQVREVEIVKRTQHGVIKDPSGQGFSAMVWELDQNSSLGLCTFFRQQNAYCDVMTPESFASIATLAAQSEKALPVPQGADSAPRSKKRQRR